MQSSEDDESKGRGSCSSLADSSDSDGSCTGFRRDPEQSGPLSECDDSWGDGESEGVHSTSFDSTSSDDDPGRTNETSKVPNSLPGVARKRREAGASKRRGSLSQGAKSSENQGSSSGSDLDSASCSSADGCREQHASSCRASRSEADSSMSSHGDGDGSERQESTSLYSDSSDSEKSGIESCRESPPKKYKCHGAEVSAKYHRPSFIRGQMGHRVGDSRVRSEGQSLRGGACSERR